MNVYVDFNDAENQGYNLIPVGTQALVFLEIKRNPEKAFNDPSQGFVDNFVTQSQTGALFLNARYTILEGEYRDRVVYQMIGIHSPKGDTWRNMGRKDIKAIINSSRGLSEKDISIEARNKRILENGFHDLHESVLAVEIGIDVNKQTGDERNKIKKFLTPDDHPIYTDLMSNAHKYFVRGKEFYQPPAIDDGVPF